MSTFNLRDTEGLRAACRQVEAERDDSDWERRLEAFLDKVQATSEAERASEAFQRLLWDENPVCAAGKGTTNVDRAISSPEFRAWLARESGQALPTDREARIERLSGLREQLLEKLKPHVDRTPHLKVYRVLAAFFPRDFTVFGSINTLRRLREALIGGTGPRDRVEVHASVLRRLEEVLGPPADGTKALVRRMTLPWKLYDAFVREEGAEEDEATESGGDLKPLPAARRRRGLTATRGGFARMLEILEYAKDGVPRADLFAYLRSSHPDAMVPGAPERGGGGGEGRQRRPQAQAIVMRLTGECRR